MRSATSTFGSMPEGDSVTLAQADFVGGMPPSHSPPSHPYTHLCLPADWSTTLYSCAGLTPLPTPPLPLPLMSAGGEVRLPSGSEVTHAVLACQGASLGGTPAKALTAGLLQHVLGGYSYVKWGGTASRLGKAVAAATGGPFAVSHRWEEGGRSGGCKEGLGRCCVCAVSTSGVCAPEVCPAFVHR